MALADFLSAIRELILDDGVVGATAADRRRALESRFPRLSSDQLDDLAGISPARLQVYTDLIFAGERSTLEWVYPVSLAVIGRLRADAGDRQPPRLADFELVRALHRFRPWTSNSQRQLAADFEAFLRTERGEWLASWPGLGDLLEFERAELEVFYGEDVAHEQFTTAVAESLMGLSVEALMSRSVVVPPYVAVRLFRYDVPALVSQFRNEPRLPEVLPGPSECPAACGRNGISLLPEWTRLETREHAALLPMPRGESIALNELAAAFLEAGEEGAESEEAAFGAFFAFLHRMLGSGVVLLAARNAGSPVEAR